MTIEEFAKNTGKKESLVIEWIRKGLIPNASVDNNYIPDSARLPYTKARAKTSTARYVSMIRATENFYHILPKLYGICKDEFDAYIERLVEAKLIVRRVTDNVKYYDTLYNGTAKKSFIIRTIEALACGIAEGATTAIIKNLK